MILHIAPDDKFIPFLQGLFEEASPSGSLWRVLADKPTPIFAAQSVNTETIKGGYFSSEKFKQDLQVADCVIFHSLSLTSLQTLSVLRCISKTILIVWRGWGFDYYDYIVENQSLQLILPETSALMSKPTIWRNPLSKLPTIILRRLFYNFIEKSIAKKFIARVNYFSCCVPDDYEALKKALPNFTAQFLPLNYYSMEDVFLRGENLSDLSGKDILLGNSASPTNNHVEAMIMMSKLGMNGRKVIVPLSYGDNDYQQKVMRAGVSLFGESFVPLTKFVTLPEYNQIVSSCGNVMMNHVRQQAIGNISAALLRGGKVYLRPENPIYKYYTRLGVKLFPFSDGLVSDQFDIELSQDDIARNKRIMTSIWAREIGLRQAKTISLLRCDEQACNQKSCME